MELNDVNKARRFFEKWAVVSLLLVCGSPAVSALDLVQAGSAPALATAGLHYSIRPDLRRCISPLCGGYWITAVNRRLTPCADGSLQKECYVSGIDWQALGLSGSEGASLVLGSQRIDNVSGFGPFGVLVPQEAWRPATDAVPKGTWFALRDNGMRCITYPCYSIDEQALNRHRTQTISGVDLGSVGATDSDQKAAMDALVHDRLIAVGMNKIIPNEGPAGDGIEMSASQFFLPVTQAVDTSLYCTTSGDCTLTAYHSFVRSPDECYCPLCPVPLSAEAAKANQASWERHCTNFGYSIKGNVGSLICPMVLCVAPDPVGCVDNQCSFLESSPLPLLQ